MDTTSRRWANAILLTAAFLLTEFGRRFYRPYIYSNGIEDLGLADTIGNLGGVVVIVFFDAVIADWTPQQTIRYTWFLIVPGMLLYEALQGNLLPGTFDWGDVGATLLGAVAATALNRWIHAGAFGARLQTLRNSLDTP
jgi:hypothetical protein